MQYSDTVLHYVLVKKLLSFICVRLETALSGVGVPNIFLTPCTASAFRQMSMYPSGFL